MRYMGIKYIDKLGFRQILGRKFQLFWVNFFYLDLNADIPYTTAVS